MISKSLLPIRRRRRIRVSIVCFAMLSALEPVLVARLVGGEGSHEHSSHEDPAHVHTASEQPAANPDGDAERLLSAMEALDEALAAKLRLQIDNEQAGDAALKRETAAQRVFDRHCLVEIAITPESRVKVEVGSATHELTSGEWRTYFVKVNNDARVTAPLRAFSAQFVGPHAEVRIPRTREQRKERLEIADARDRWLEFHLVDSPPSSATLSGSSVEYLLARLRTNHVEKRSAVIAFDVGQGTADIGFRSDVTLTFICKGPKPKVALPSVCQPTGARRPGSDADLRRWLENMIWHHRYSDEEVCQATGLSLSEVRRAEERFDVSRATKPAKAADAPLTVLPYPGGRHPRIGFQEGAVRPQRETKASVFLPWDSKSYVVLDLPEAVWSNLGLTYLAHTHVPTLWDQQGIALPPLEWQRDPDGSLRCERTLPNGIAFGTRLTPTQDVVRMEMWLTNGTPKPLTDLRVQNCVLLKGAAEFAAQSNDNKVFSGSYAACRNERGDRWIIMAWERGRGWGNPPCPCLHSDPQFPDCQPGETQRLRGWLSFFRGSDVKKEFARIESIDWRSDPVRESHLTELTGSIVDAKSGELLPARLTIRGADGSRYLVQSLGGRAALYRREKPQFPLSPEVHSSLSTHPFSLRLAPGVYTVRAERGKEYVPCVRRITIETERLSVELPLRRWADMASRGWYSGDVHVHRQIVDLPSAMLAEDLNVALPLSYWAMEAGKAPTSPREEPQIMAGGLIKVDDTHVIYPVNTEYEIMRVEGQDCLLGAILVLNHKTPLDVGAPPVKPVAELARRQGALLDLEKHTWPWSVALVPVLDIDLFELANNHVWQTSFGLPKWGLDSAPQYMHLEQNVNGFTEQGWIDFGLQTYYALVNCGFRLRVSAGTASGVHPVPLGFSRVYVNLPKGFSYEDWIAGLNAGHSFVSTGPLLDVTFNRSPPGSMFRFGEKQVAAIQVKGVALSRRPLERIEIIVNGRVRETVVPENKHDVGTEYASPIETTIDGERSFWVAVRCYENHPWGRVRFAHTNPVYADIAGKPLISRRAEADYLVTCVSRALKAYRDRLSPAAREEFVHALAIYERIAEQSR